MLKCLWSKILSHSQEWKCTIFKQCITVLVLAWLLVNWISTKLMLVAFWHFDPFVIQWFNGFKWSGSLFGWALIWIRCVRGGTRRKKWTTWTLRGPELITPADQNNDPTAASPCLKTKSDELDGKWRISFFFISLFQSRYEPPILKSSQPCPYCQFQYWSVEGAPKQQSRLAQRGIPQTHNSPTGDAHRATFMCL